MPIALRIGAVVLLCGVAGELTLQLSSPLVRALVSRGEAASPAQAEITILCVGDSHTYGLPLPAEDSYPSQLRQVLSDRHPEVSFRAINLGIPGVNSAFVANRLEQQILQLAPHLVIVWVGVNNQWNVIESEAWGERGRWDAARRTLLRSRLFRLASIAWYTRVGHQYDVEERGGWFEGEHPPSGRPAGRISRDDPPPGLAFDIGRMIDIARALDTPILFVGYPFSSQERINRAILAGAGSRGIAVVDTSHSRRRALADGHSPPELADHRMGMHPTRLLYRYVVEDMAPQVSAHVAAWHATALETAGR